MQYKNLLSKLRAIHDNIRDLIVAECEKTAIEHLSAVHSEGHDDTIYRIDHVGEQQLVKLVEDQRSEEAHV